MYKLISKRSLSNVGIVSMNNNKRRDNVTLESVVEKVEKQPGTKKPAGVAK